jgi:putative phosphoribosyl transferase
MFHDRSEAGRLLAERLEGFRAELPIVFGLTRGGVPVAFEVARRLGAPLEPMVVRKIGAPLWPEYAIGALAEGGAVYVNAAAIRELGLGREQVAALAEREAVELSRRVRAYRGDRAFPDVSGRTVILVDDGVATGATARAAGRAVRNAGATRVILAAPVIAAQSEPALRPEFDEIVAVEVPEPFIAVGMWYARFEQLSDEEVVEYLRRAREASREEGGELWNGEWTGPEPEQEPRREPEEQLVAVPIGSPSGPDVLDATLGMPERPRGLVMFVHGSGSTRNSPRNRFVASRLQHVGFATLLLDLLTPEEAAEDGATGRLRFDVGLLAGRVVAATRWIAARPDTSALRLGYFGASTGAAAALVAAAAEPDRVAAVVSRGGRPDLVERATLERVRAPVLLVVGGRDEPVLELNRAVLPFLHAARLEVVRGATHLFEEPGALEAVVRLSAGWFDRHLAATASGPRPAIAAP